MWGIPNNGHIDIKNLHIAITINPLKKNPHSPHFCNNLKKEQNYPSFSIKQKKKVHTPLTIFQTK